MKKILVLVLVALMILPAVALADEVVNVFNWYDYIDESVFEQFTEETGIKVNAMYFTTNEEMMVQVEANPGAFDVCFPSEYIVERMLNKNLLAEINYDNVPNMQYTLDNLRNPSYDPENAHSVPYMWGTVGILYNTTKVENVVDSWEILWNEKYPEQRVHAGFHPRFHGRDAEVSGLFHEYARHCGAGSGEGKADRAEAAGYGEGVSGGRNKGQDGGGRGCAGGDVVRRCAVFH